jgi:N-acetylneuraminate synthase/sialic acid synthase
MKIGDREVGDATSPYVVAEVGHNHGGDLRCAEELLRAAKRSGADSVKLQKRHNRSIFTRAMYDEPYTGRNSFGPTYGTHREALEFGLDEYRYLAKVATEIGIDFFATAFDPESADFLAELDVPAIKVSSSDLINTPLLAHIAGLGKPMIVSTGGACMEEVWQAYRAIRRVAPKLPLALLQCTAIYPAKPADLSLSVITTYREAFPDAVIGFSGHDFGPEMSLIAQSLGARVIEKHFTLDREAPGSDHHFSLQPEDMSKLTSDLAKQSAKILTPDQVAATDPGSDVMAALGSRKKTFSEIEKAATRKLAKSLVAARDLPAGHRVTEADLAHRSPGGGPMKPYQIGEVLGRLLRERLPEDGQFRPELLSEDADTFRQ